MKLAICHPVVEPERGGCEIYLAMLLHRLCKDGHQVHLFASRWDEAAMPERLVIHPLPDYSRPRFLRPWRFSAACRHELSRDHYDLSIGFDKVTGVDVLYPQGGVYAASIAHGRNRFPSGWQRELHAWLRMLDPACLSQKWLERRQYAGPPAPFVLAISEMTRGHLARYLGVPRERTAVLRAAIDPDRLAATDRPARRVLARQQWGVEPDEVFAVFLGVNPRLKGLAPLLHAVARLKDRSRFRLGVFSVRQPGEYVRLARQLRIADCVRFIGFVPEVRDIYFAGDLLIHPTFYDPCSLVVLEALTVGLPVITTRYNGAAELLDPPADSRVIDDPHDHDTLAAAIGDFLDNDTRRAAARAAVRAGAKWTFDDHYRELIRHLEQAWHRKQAA
jgi:UDP-glucose:(heptosyl)LPS alpha-1,3-glucosyltransferase